MPRPYAAALGWLRREMGEVDLGAVEAMKAPQHDHSALACISPPMRPPIAAEPPPLALGTLWAPSGHPLGTLWAHSGHTLGTLWAHSGHTLGTLWAPLESPRRCRREAAVVRMCQHSTLLAHC